MERMGTGAPPSEPTAPQDDEALLEALNDEQFRLKAQPETDEARARLAEIGRQRSSIIVQRADGLHAARGRTPGARSLDQSPDDFAHGLKMIDMLLDGAEASAAWNPDGPRQEADDALLRIRHLMLWTKKYGAADSGRLEQLEDRLAKLRALRTRLGLDTPT